MLRYFLVISLQAFLRRGVPSLVLYFYTVLSQESYENTNGKSETHLFPLQAAIDQKTPVP